MPTLQPCLVQSVPIACRDPRPTLHVKFLPAPRFSLSPPHHTLLVSDPTHASCHSWAVSPRFFCPTCACVRRSCRKARQALSSLLLPLSAPFFSSPAPVRRHSQHCVASSSPACFNPFPVRPFTLPSSCCFPHYNTRLLWAPTPRPSPSIPRQSLTDHQTTACPFFVIRLFTRLAPPHLFCAQPAICLRPFSSTALHCVFVSDALPWVAVVEVYSRRLLVTLHHFTFHPVDNRCFVQL